jgi:hypothetical protein
MDLPNGPKLIGSREELLQALGIEPPQKECEGEVPNGPKLIGSREELLQVLGIEPPQKEYEDEGEIVCLLKNYPVIKDMAEEAVKEKAMFKKAFEMNIMRFEKEQE